MSRSRPCTCNRAYLNSHYSPDQCRRCWLFFNDKRHRIYWGGEEHQSPESNPDLAEAKERPHPGMCSRCILEKIQKGEFFAEYPSRWQEWDVVKKSFHTAAKGFLASVRAYSGPVEGRGIIVSGGGRYLPGAWITCKIIRSLGCNLPLQVWYLGRHNELPQGWDVLFKKTLPDVELVDADQVSKSSPEPARILNGFELKLFSVNHCPWKEVLLLDADAYPVENPEFLFDLPDYKQKGSIWFPDLANTDSWTKWDFWGVKNYPGSGPPLETGEYVINRDKSHLPLQLAYWYDQRSDWCYGNRILNGDYGDKGPNRVAWTQLKYPKVLFQQVPIWETHSFLHLGPFKEPLFVHRCRDKPKLPGLKFDKFTTTPQRHTSNLFCSKLPQEKLFFHFLQQLESECKSLNLLST